MAMGKVSDWLKEYGGQIASAIVILGALLAGVQYVVKSEVADIRSDVSSVKSDVAELKTGSLKTNSRIDDLLKEALERAFPAPSPTANKAELEEDFKHANSLLQLATAENIHLNSKLMVSYGKQIASISEEPAASDAVWPAAAELINYRSQSASPDWSSLTQSNLPNCTDHDPVPAIVTSNTEHEIRVRNPYYENCRFTLDSPTDDAKVNSFLQNISLFLHFRHCLIIYKGGNINLLVAIRNRTSIMQLINPDGSRRAISTPFEYSGPTLSFENCVFRWETGSPPPPEGKRLTKILLAADGDEITYIPATS